MKGSRSILLFVLLFVVLANDGPFVRASSETFTEPSTTNEEQILLDCQNPNYQTYIKCLKHSNHKGSKVKRHHHPRSEENPEIDHHCMESCLKTCESSLTLDCHQKCGHCIKRTKHRHQIITEYETECTDGDCKETNDNRLPNMANITTSIQLHNVINTGSGGNGSGRGNDSCNCTCCPTCRCPTSCCGGGWGGGGNSGGGGGAFSQLTLVPQLTLGLGLGVGLGGGCNSPYPWLCPPYQGPPAADCSECHYPFMRYRCDVSCYAYHGQQGYSSKTIDKPPCQSPHCVGGM